MKFKKLVTSKPFIAGTLAFLSIGIIATCLLWPKEKPSTFLPDAEILSSEPLPDKWEEIQSDSSTGSNAEGEPAISSQDEYPKIIESDEKQTIIDFTDPIPEKPEAPPTPEGKSEVADPGPSHAPKEDPTVTPPKQESKSESKSEPKPESKPKTEPKDESKKPSTPAPGSKNEKGQVYDPVFGWITPSTVEQEIIDGDGDPNKIIGDMD